MIELIGGIEVEGRLRRDVTLKPLTGAAELALAELSRAELTQPEKVSLFLNTTLSTVGGAPADPSALCVGDRQYLVRQIGAGLGVDQLWLGGDCTACEEPFEVCVRQAELPVKRAGTGYPGTTVIVGGAEITVRAPNGADQDAIAGMPQDEAALMLLHRVADLPADFELDEAAHAALEEAIEALSPEVALEVAAECPACGAAQRLEVDPYLTLTQSGQGIFDDVHVLARHYHWAEAEILSLPRSRRHAYLARIDRDRGMTANPELGEVL